jgi:hypothetical protein
MNERTSLNRELLFFKKKRTGNYLPNFYDCKQLLISFQQPVMQCTGFDIVLNGGWKCQHEVEDLTFVLYGSFRWHLLISISFGMPSWEIILEKLIRDDVSSRHVSMFVM